MPEDVRQALRDRIWREARALGWDALTQRERSAAYARWEADPLIRHAIAQYLGDDAVRVYLKDSIVRELSQSNLIDEHSVAEDVGAAAKRTYAIIYKERERNRATFRDEDGNVACVTWGWPMQWKDQVVKLLEARDEVEERRAKEGVTRPVEAVLVIYRDVTDSDALVARVERIAERCRLTVVVRDRRRPGRSQVPAQTHMLEQ